MKKKFQIFVSSTKKDLEEERQAAVEAILDAGHIPAGMELFPAGNELVLETIFQWIDESDIFMLILGNRYGSVDTDSGISYMELEFDYAVKKKVPCFAVVVSKEMEERKVKEHGSQMLETENPEKAKKFRQKVRRRMSKTVHDVKELKLAVFKSINDIDRKYDLRGWLPANEAEEASNISHRLDEICDYVRANQNVPFYVNHLRAQPEMKKCIEKLLEEKDKISLTMIGVTLCYSWPFLSKIFAPYLDRRTAHSLDGKTISIEIAILDENFPKKNGFVFWRNGNLADTIEDIRNFKLLHSDFMTENGGPIKIEIYSYSFLPGQHGLLIDSTELFKSDCKWRETSSNFELTVGKNQYYNYAKHDDFGGAAKIEQFISLFHFYRSKGTKIDLDCRNIIEAE